MCAGLRSVGCFFCTLLAAVLACTPASGPEELIGTWDGASRTLKAVVVHFAADGASRLQFEDPQGQVVRLNGDYEVNFSKQPVPLSIRNIPQLPHPLHTILRYDGPDNLRMGVLAPRWRLRPITFVPKTEILLERRSRSDETLESQ